MRPQIAKYFSYMLFNLRLRIEGNKVFFNKLCKYPSNKESIYLLDTKAIAIVLLLGAFFTIFSL